MAGILYLVATPIGNLGDLSPRAVETLAQADFIAAEDTLVSLRLLNHFDIRKPLVSYHEHNRAAAGPAIAERLLGGESCALVTDAGTPAISDPGEDLVRLCGQQGITVQAIPGCCAAVCALAVSGLPTGRFCFEGFLSANKKERRTRLEELSREERTMVFHEAPHKLRPTLADMLKVLEFGFDSDNTNGYLPHNFKTTNSICYTGTHDNETILGWIKSCDEKTRNYCKDYLGVTKDEFVPWAMVRLCWSSVCDTAIAQMQDILCLDDKARMNTPSTVGANWKWRLESFDKLDDTLAERLAKITAVYGR